MNDYDSRPLLVFDCDPGCDDALAIALVARLQRYRSLNLLTVAGNVSVDQTTANACRIAALLGIENCTTVYRGCSRGLMGDTPSAASVHGRDGLGDAPNNLVSPVLEPIAAHLETNAVQRLVELSRGDTCFDLLCTGPLTNLAIALNLMDCKQRSGFWSHCERFVVMGGCFGSQGNITHSAEFNSFFDPVATQMVLEFLREARGGGKSSSGGTAKGPSVPDIHFVPLDATETVAISLSRQRKQPEPERAAKFLFYALQQYGEFHAFHCKRPDEADNFGIEAFSEEVYVRAQLGGSTGISKLNKFCYLHDPLAAWALLNWEAVKGFWQRAEIRLDTGHGDSRGRIIHCASKLGNAGPIRSIELGTQVSWLCLAREEPRASTFRREFVTAIAKLLCLPVEDTVKPVRKELNIPILGEQ